MNEIIPFTSREELSAAIDNGGRFYNLFSAADDKIVSKAELAKAAGVFVSAQVALLFLDLAANELSEAERNEIISMLEPSLREKFYDEVRRKLSPSSVESEGEAGDCVIVEGFTRRLSDKSQFTGFIMIPNIVGGITTFTMIPIFEMFDVYEFFEEDDFSSASTVVAAKAGSDFADGAHVRFGGYLRALEVEEESARTHRLYLEASYFTRLIA